ncbi:MAG: hypothetical protein FIA99_17165 [Ruminiclostridium sp.]|nr:hypothetical protein [Ruminiclostridium sp.]
MEKLIIIADDLTGACDTGSYICDYISSVSVHVDSANPNIKVGQTDKVQVYNTYTRTIGAEQAYKKVYLLGQQVNALESKVVVKKIDTAYRGHAAIELNALMDSLKIGVCFVINAIPSINRITVGGFQIIDGRLLEQTDFVWDPVNPAKGSFIPDILQPLSKRRIGIITLQDIRKGNIAGHVNEHLQKNNEIIIFDSATDEDISNILEALYDRYTYALWAGSLGLIQHLSKKFFGNNEAVYDINGTKKKFYSNKGSSDKKAVIFTASIHFETKRQIEYADEMGKVSVINIKIKNIPERNCLYADMEKSIDCIIAALKKTNVAVIPDIDEDIQLKDIDKEILGIISTIARKVCMNEEAGNIVLIGGDTAYSILNALEASVIEVTGRIEQAMAYGLISDGKSAGKHFSIKGGSVGNKDALLKMLDIYYERGHGYE